MASVTIRTEKYNFHQLCSEETAQKYIEKIKEIMKSTANES